MVSKKRSQAALEYMMVVFISLLLISGFSYYFFQQKTSYEEDAMREKVNSIGKRVSQYAEEAAYSTGPYRKTLQVNVPESVQKVYVHDKRYLVFETTQGDSFVYHSDSPIYGYMENSSVHSGEVIVEKVDGQPVVCGESPCECMDNETGYCNDKADNDCDGLVDGADFPDCCPDDDSDGYADIDYAGTDPEWCQPPDTFAGDCDSTRADVNPGHIEMCNSVDHDCDGDNRNKACLFKCYLEDQMNQNGYNNCTENYFNLLQLENTTNAHAEEPGGSNNYEYDLCCQHKETTGVNLSCIVREGTTNCLASEEKALGFNVDGFHAEEPTANTEPDSLCCNVSNPAGDFDCRRTLSGSSCLSNETGLVSLASPENSHLAEYGEYGYNICCQVDY